MEGKAGYISERGDGRISTGLEYEKTMGTVKHWEALGLGSFIFIFIFHSLVYGLFSFFVSVRHGYIFIFTASSRLNIPYTIILFNSPRLFKCLPSSHWYDDIVQLVLPALIGANVNLVAIYRLISYATTFSYLDLLKALFIYASPTIKLIKTPDYYTGNSAENALKCATASRPLHNFPHARQTPLPRRHTTIFNDDTQRLLKSSLFFLIFLLKKFPLTIDFTININNTKGFCYNFSGAFTFH